jgi:hypothetical protein
MSIRVRDGAYPWKQKSLLCHLRGWLLLGCLVLPGFSVAGAASKETFPVSPTSWPVITREQRPWAYWWWMGSAVDKTNLTRELTRYRDAGYGGIHIVPIYGAKGWETNYVPYLSSQWMELLRHTVTESQRLGLGVDMTTGTGWCFGGPRVTDDEANANVVCKTFDVPAAAQLAEKFDVRTTQALMAFGPDGRRVELTDRIGADGSVNWTVDGGPWRVFAVSQKPSGQRVKRPAPGGEGHMLNLAYPLAMTNYLRWFDEAFARYDGPKPRAQYHDSYEYRTDWAPDFFSQFEKRRGYRLQDELPALFGNEPTDRAARVKTDYRQTLSDVMAEVTLPVWADWSRRHGFLTRNQAHGSPGNWLDLYAAADIPETEMFHNDRNILISKFASSAAHVTGKPLVSAETGTWLNEHFTETLADMKYLLDDLYLSGVNHVFYHGTCYSPDEAGWPGWLFYASTEMNPRNSIWRDVPALNAYIARCQAILQSGQPDNDILLYWNTADFWMQPGKTLLPRFTVHNRDWFEGQPIGRTAKELWDKGYAFDYVSDAQLKTAKAENGMIHLPRSREYSVILVPKCKYIPLETFRQLLSFAQNGARVVFEEQLPEDISGLVSVEKRDDFKRLIAQLSFRTGGSIGLRDCAVVRFGNNGYFVKGDLKPALQFNAVGPQSALAFSGLSFIRHEVVSKSWWNYFVVNNTGTNFDGWILFGCNEKSAVLLDPMTGKAGVAATRQMKIAPYPTEYHLQLRVGESIIIRTFEYLKAEGPAWTYWQTNGQPMEISGDWKVKFIEGGPVLPADFQTAKLESWTTFPDTNAQAFAGTAKYTIAFDAPDSEFRPAGGTAPGTLKRELQHYFLDLGDVRQSARVKVNGKDYGVLFTPPFRVVVNNLKPKNNWLEVEVTNVSANRIRDLDRRSVKWKNFHDINFVDLNYKPFDASDWPLTDSGLLGTVTLTLVRE